MGAPPRHHVDGRRAPIASLCELATHDDPQSPLTPGETAAAGTGNDTGVAVGSAGASAAVAPAVAEATAPAADTAPGPASAMSPATIGLASFGGALLLLLLGYVVLTAPGAWFPAASPQSWGPRDASLTRGSGAIDGDVLMIDAAEPGSTAVLSIKADIRSTDYRAIAWRLANVPEQADVRMFWRSDYAPAKMNSVPVTVAAGHLLPVDVSREATWIGRITGLALAIRTTGAQPVQFLGVTAKPRGALELLHDRAGEWLAFESWTGVSMNTITGGAAVQDLPLPFLLAAAAALAMLAALLLLRRFSPIASLPLALGAIFVAAWIVADLRWEWNLARQAIATRDQYGGKDWQGKHLAAEDGKLFAFIENVRAKLPPAPARIFVVAEAHYFRDRAAYHLYPHNVHFEPYRDMLPPSAALRAGDYLVVYLRRGIQYDAKAQRLRFPDGSTLAAEVQLAEAGGALFAIR